jgi:hypothetical protein
MTKGLKDPKDMDKLIEAGLSVLDAGSITPDEIINLINELESHLVDNTVEYDYDNASDYEKFKKLLKQYNNNLPKIIKDYVLDYINNERVLSVQIILALMTGLGLDGSIMDINAPAGSGKTENKKAPDQVVRCFMLQCTGEENREVYCSAPATEAVVTGSSAFSALISTVKE